MASLSSVSDTAVEDVVVSQLSPSQESNAPNNAKELINDIAQQQAQEILLWFQNVYNENDKRHLLDDAIKSAGELLKIINSHYEDDDFMSELKTLSKYTKLSGENFNISEYCHIQYDSKTRITTLKDTNKQHPDDKSCKLIIIYTRRSGTPLEPGGDPIQTLSNQKTNVKFDVCHTVITTPNNSNQDIRGRKFQLALPLGQLNEKKPSKKTTKSQKASSSSGSPELSIQDPVLQRFCKWLERDPNIGEVICNAIDECRKRGAAAVDSDDDSVDGIVQNAPQFPQFQRQKRTRGGSSSKSTNKNISSKPSLTRVDQLEVLLKLVQMKQRSIEDWSQMKDIMIELGYYKEPIDAVSLSSDDDDEEEEDDDNKLGDETPTSASVGDEVNDKITKSLRENIKIGNDD